MKILFRNDESMKDAWYFLVEFTKSCVVWSGKMEEPNAKMKKGDKAIQYQRNRSNAPVSYTKISEKQAEKILNSKNPENTIKGIWCDLA